MVKSMTGFGKGEAVYKEKQIKVELRSVNSKQLDLSIKAPGRYRALEGEMRTLIGRVAKRGKVDCYITNGNTRIESKAHINPDLFASFTQQLGEVARANGIDLTGSEAQGMLMQAVLRMPEVITTEDPAMDPEEGKCVLAALGEALEHFDSFRQTEGATLIADLFGRVEKIEAYKAAVEPYEKARVEKIKQRIRDHIAELNIPLDSNRLEQEMIYYVEKLDITEEKVRLKQHCDYFREVASQEEEPGRKLGFIAQEMGREINTLGSKSNEANMQILVVKMKDELEKIKEQVLNLL